MVTVTYILAVIVVLGFCAVGLSIGLLIRKKGLRTCGRIMTPDGEEISCGACGATKAADCKREKEKEAPAKA